MNDPSTRAHGMGGRLYAYRIARSMTLSDVHEASGVAMSYLSRLEQSGNWGGASLGRIAMIARAVGVTPGDLIGANYLWKGTLGEEGVRKRDE